MTELSKAGYSSGFSNKGKYGNQNWKNKNNQQASNQGIYPTSSTISRGIGPLVQEQEPVDPAAIDNAPVLQPDSVALISKGGLAPGKKMRRPVLFLRPDQLTNKQQGLYMLYRVISKQTEDFLFKCSNGSLDKALKDYVGVVKEWGFNVAPKYSYEYLMDRMQAMGRRKELMDELTGLRSVQQGKLSVNADTGEFEKIQAATSMNFQGIGQIKQEVSLGMLPQLRLTVDQGPVMVDEKSITRVKINADDIK